MTKRKIRIRRKKTKEKRKNKMHLICHLSKVLCLLHFGLSHLFLVFYHILFLVLMHYVE